jgi:uncharacterized membrane protein
MGLYGTAAMISCGPWLISILTLLLIGVLGQRLLPNAAHIERFQTSVTWLFATSLLLSGALQLLFTRFVADRIYEKHSEKITPNLYGALALTSVVAATLACAFSSYFAEESWGLRLVLALGFVTMCNIWIVIVTLSVLKEHGKVFLSFFLGYLMTFVATLSLGRWGDVGLLGGFVLGQVTLLFFSIATVAALEPGEHAVSWDFLRRRQIHPDLLLIGFLANAATWVDKFFFWLNPHTSEAVVGLFRSSEVYDLPIFLAYLAIVPGMTIFLLRVETDFAEHHAHFYDSLRTDAPLTRLEELQQKMIQAAQRGIIDIVKTQGVTLLLCVLFAAKIFSFFGISTLHLPLFYVYTLGVSIQVLLMAIINFFFYLDRRRVVLLLTLLQLAGNMGGTWLSQCFGFGTYGWGFALANLLSCFVGWWLLRGAFRTLLRDTFMGQRY